MESLLFDNNGSSSDRSIDRSFYETDYLGSEKNFTFERFDKTDGNSKNGLFWGSSDSFSGDGLDFQPAVPSNPRSRQLLTSSSVTPQTRHARRIYVGNIPVGYLDEEAIKNFLNSVICKGLGEESDTSFVLSIYINQQKCFAFVELNSIELTTACLELDGILYRNCPLKILRANEYKPELVPPSSFPPIKLNLSGLMFGNTAGIAQPSPSVGVPLVDPQIDQLIKYCSVNTVQKGSLVVIGFPYEDTSRKFTGFGSATPSNPALAKTARGCAFAPRMIRNALRRFQSGCSLNPEFQADITSLKIVDVGDVQSGMPLQEAYNSLTEIVAEVVQRGGIPIVLGGPSEISTFAAQGLMSVCTAPIAHMNVAPVVDPRILDDIRFYFPKGHSSGRYYCDGRFVQFAAQGSMSSLENTRLVEERGGNIVWLSKDIRGIPYFSHDSTAVHEVSAKYRRCLHAATADVSPQDSPTSTSSVTTSSASSASAFRPTSVSIDVSSMSSSSFPAHANCNSNGLTAAEVSSICLASGMDPNVLLFSLTEFNPEIEEHRSSRVVVDLLYNFILGVSLRNRSQPRSHSNSQVSVSSRPTSASTHSSNVVNGSSMAAISNSPYDASQASKLLPSSRNGMGQSSNVPSSSWLSSSSSVSDASSVNRYPTSRAVGTGNGSSPISMPVGSIPMKLATSNNNASSANNLPMKSSGSLLSSNTTSLNSNYSNRPSTMSNDITNLSADEWQSVDNEPPVSSFSCTMTDALSYGFSSGSAPRPMTSGFSSNALAFGYGGIDLTNRPSTSSISSLSSAEGMEQT